MNCLRFIHGIHVFPFWPRYGHFVEFYCFIDFTIFKISLCTVHFFQLLVDGSVYKFEFLSSWKRLRDPNVIPFSKHSIYQMLCNAEFLNRAIYKDSKPPVALHLKCTFQFEDTPYCIQDNSIQENSRQNSSI